MSQVVRFHFKHPRQQELTIDLELSVLPRVGELVTAPALISLEMKQANFKVAEIRWSLFTGGHDRSGACVDIECVPDY